MTAQPNLSLGRGIAVIHALAQAQGPVGSRELARRLNQEHTRVNRLLGTLTTLGLAMRTKDRRYCPGPGIHVLAANCLRGSGLLQAVMPEIQAILGQGHGAALGVLWREEVCYLFHGSAGQPLLAGLAGHEVYPASRSSIGRIIQAHQAEEPTDPALAAIRQAGWALSQPFDGEGISLAVPIGAPAIAGLAAIVGDIPASAHAPIAARLKAAAARIHLELIKHQAG